MKPEQLKELLKQGTKAAGAVGGWRLLNQISHKLPGKTGKVLRGIAVVGAFIVPLLRKNKKGPF